MVRMIQLNLKGGTVIQMEKWAEAAVAQLVEWVAIEVWVCGWIGKSQTS